MKSQKQCLLDHMKFFFRNREASLVCCNLWMLQVINHLFSSGFPLHVGPYKNPVLLFLLCFWIWHFLAFRVLIGLLSLYSPIKYFSSHSCMDCLSLFLHTDVAGSLDMPFQVHLCCHTSAGTLMWMCLCRCMSGHTSAYASVQTCLCRWTCVDLHLWVQPCGHACSDAFKMPLQMNLCRHASAGTLCGCAYGGTCLDMSWQMSLLVHLRCLCRGACGNVPLQAHLRGCASLPSHMQVYLASFLPVWK